MRYDHLRTRYPQIETLFAQVAQYVHGKAGPELAFGWAERWIAQYICPEHRQDVTNKVQKFIAAINKVV